MLFRGVGGTFHPYAPLIDKIIITRLLGVKTAPSIIFASTDKSQAIGYAREEQESWLQVVLPGVGSVVRWIPGVKDMTLDFERFLRSIRFDDHPPALGHFIRDIAGDISILEQYLALGRQGRAIQELVDRYLKDHILEERVVGDPADLEMELQDHQGEVWLTAPYELLAYEPQPVQGLK